MGVNSGHRETAKQKDIDVEVQYNISLQFTFSDSFMSLISVNFSALLETHMYH